MFQNFQSGFKDPLGNYKSKNNKPPCKICDLVSRYLQTFSCVIGFLNHILRGTRFLSIESEFPNNLKLRILGNNISIKSLKHLEIKPSAWPTELKVFTVTLENCKEFLLEYFTEKLILLDFGNLSTSTFCPRL